ncbi:dimethylargininase [Streptomyces rubellomurinus]|uniref:Amidinotransferase n=2 Tax=Streptomyces TaxID=1883 RepID=A0A0F2T6R7_STRR3|nr:dimethylargininase [Streptomyces rubellomurinus]KJS54914.1 amidinotransferase [Streptomyces rubellomurinus subsp. indigoferus]KJS58101.1 amidinotransferase [Streptomyces rubellomurinus]
MSAQHPARTATARHYLMCRPTYFTVDYRINPWMDPAKPVDTALAVLQWERLRELHRSLGHTVELIEPIPGLPDMVYAANGATVHDGRVLGARFRHPERAAEGPAYEQWFRDAGHAVVKTAEYVNEGEGDYLVVGDRVLAGTGFRTEPAAHAEAQELFGVPVTGLTLVDPRFYHLDTALAVLGDEIMYFPGAFSPASRRVLRELYPDAIVADEAEALVFGLNAVCDGRHVILPQAATTLAAKLAARGYEPIGIDLSELLKGGGSVKCCTLEIRHASAGGPR